MDGCHRHDCDPRGISFADFCESVCPSDALFDPVISRSRTLNKVHTWTFDGGVAISASPSPSVVPVPYSNPAHVDPEQALVAAVSSCHMLTYLYLACHQCFQVDSYQDEAVGVMTKSEKGVPWVSVISLHPHIVYSGDKRPEHCQF
jgi:organic hydroperoxide reductase OsmC/OhrA